MLVRATLPGSLNIEGWVPERKFAKVDPVGE